MQRVHREITSGISFLFSKKWLMMLCIAAFVEAVGMGIISPINALYARSFGLSTTMVGIYMTIFAVGRVIVNIPAGHIADRIDRRKLVVIAPFILALSALGLATAENYVQLLLFRFLHGIGSGLFLVGGFLIIAEWSSFEERGRNNSLFQANTVLGLTISPFLGGIIATYIGFTAVFYFHSIIAFLIGVFVWFNFNYLSDREPLEVLSSKDIERIAPEKIRKDPPMNWNLLLASLVGFIVFVSRSGSRDTMLPLISANVFGLNTASIGLIFTISATMNFLTVPVAGYLSDRNGRKTVIIIGLIFNIIGLLIAGWSANLIAFLIGVTLMASGKGFGETASVVYVADISYRTKTGRSFGVFLSLRDLGLLVGPLTLGWVADQTNLYFPLVLNGFVMFIIMLLFWFFAKETVSSKNIRLCEFS